MAKNNTVALFDFCDTCVAGQTGELFLEGLIAEYGGTAKRFISFLTKIKGVGRLCKYVSINFNRKLFLLRLCKGIKHSEIKCFASIFARQLDPVASIEIGKKLDEFIEAVDQVVVVSGGFDEYIKEFFSNRPGVKVIANKIKYEGSVCQGVLASGDCMGKEKVIRLTEYFGDLETVEIVAVFSDCISDKPILSLSPSNAYKVALAVTNNSVTTHVEVWRGLHFAE